MRLNYLLPKPPPDREAPPAAKCIVCGKDHLPPTAELFCLRNEVLRLRAALGAGVKT